MKTSGAVLAGAARHAIAALLLTIIPISNGAISVGPTGLAPLTFDVLPAAADWSTLSIGMTSEYYTQALMDTAVQNVAAGTISAQVRSSTAPGVSATAQWISTGLYLETSPTGNGATLLMATLHNGAGGIITGMNIIYDLTVPAIAAENYVPGHRIYYNLSGATGGWVALTNISTTGSHTIAVNFGGSSWGAGTDIYILWADNNALGGPDGIYEIDNFAVTSVTVEDLPTAPIITQQPTNQLVISGGTAAFSVTASGTSPLRYAWRFEGGTMPNATNRTLLITNVQTTSAGLYDVIVSNSGGSMTSTVALLTVLVPPGFATQPMSQSAHVSDIVTFTFTPTGTPLFVYQWRFNGTNISGATNQTLTITNAQLANAGNYSVVINNSAGTATSGNAVLWFMGGIELYPGLPIYGPPGAVFQVQYTNNLSPDPWIVLTNFSLPGNPYLFVDPTPARIGQRFYRAVLVP